MQITFETYMQKAIELVQSSANNKVPDYFYNNWNEFWHSNKKKNMKYIALTETSNLEIYIRALKMQPVYIFGGNYYIDEQATRFFPQVSDPIMKSAISMIRSKKIPHADNIDTMLLPVYSDSARKVIEYVEEQYVVIPVEFDPDFANANLNQLHNQEKKILEQLIKTSNQKIQIEDLKDIAYKMTKCNKLFKKIERLNLSEIVKSFIKVTYYTADNLDIWIEQVEKLVTDIEEIDETENEVLLLGSPIYFPNTKMYTILDEVGIKQYKNACGVEAPLNYQELVKNKNNTSLVKQISKIHFESGYANPCCYFEKDISQLKNVKGIIYHLLKGQLIYAYEAQQLEKAAIKAGIPFVCVETDYTDADKEQLKIRLEAYSELLSQKKRG